MRHSRDGDSDDDGGGGGWGLCDVPPLLFRCGDDDVLYLGCDCDRALCGVGQH